MRSIAQTYRHEMLETALPEALFASLVELLTVTQHGELGEGGRERGRGRERENIL